MTNSDCQVQLAYADHILAGTGARDAVRLRIRSGVLSGILPATTYTAGHGPQETLIGASGTAGPAVGRTGCVRPGEGGSL
jgi:hypothetical protein